MSALRSFRRGRGGRRLWLVGATLVAAVSFGVVFVAASGAAGSPCPTPGNFEIDGDMTQQTCNPGADDWNTPNLGVQSTTQGGTYSTSGKDGGDPSGWTSTGSTPNKTDFAQAYATSRIVNGHFFVFVAWERTNVTGTQGYAIEISNAGANVGPGGTPRPIRGSGGAVFYISSQGSSAPVFNSACSYHTQSDYGTTCTSSSQLAGVTTAINTAPISDPLNNTTQPAGGFFEVALDITTLTGIAPSCPGPSAASVYLRSITGQTKNGNLKGYMAPLSVAPDSTCVPPPITTTATPGGSTAAIGSSQHDTVSVNDGTNPGVGTVKFFLCSPAEVTANGGDCSANGTQVGSAKTLDSSGAATSDSINGSTTPNDNTPGKYCWRAEFTPGANDHHFLAGSHTNSTTECFTVVKNSPTIVTTPNPTSVTLPGSATLKDSAVLSGGYNPTGTITFTLVYKGSTVDTETVSVSGNGTYTTPVGYTLPSSGTVTGTYQWNATYSGDSNNNTAAENGSADERVTVGLASPSIVTTPDPTSVTLGTASATLKDSAVLSGGSSPTGTITFTLVYKGSTVDTEQVAVSGNGTYTTPTGYTLPTSGTVTGTYQWNASYSGDGNNNAVSENDAVSERVTVSPASPTVVTTASAPATLPASVTFGDSAVVSGGYHPTGTLTFTLTGPNGFLYTQLVTVAGNGTYSASDGPIVDPHAGTYTWSVSYSGDGNNGSAVDQGGSDEQTVISPAAPGLSTTQNPDHGAIGATYKDTAHLTGGASPTGTITFHLYSNSDCTGLLHTETASVSGNGDYQTATGFVLSHAGTYYWTASYGGDSDNNAAAETSCTAEPVVVGSNSPALSTTQNPDHGAIGATYKDTAHLTGGASPTGTITFHLYSNNDCTGLLHTETASVSGNGDYQTPNGFVLSHAGTYYWTASYGGDSDNNAAAETSCTAEPVVVAPNSPGLSTTQNPASGNVGDTYNDTAHLTGGASPTGTITFKLYSNDNCTGLLHTETATVSGNGDYHTPTGFVLNSSDTYYWVATYSGDSDNQGTATGCADEPVMVNAAVIHIHKTADASQVNAGDDIGFKMTVWNSGSGDAKGVVLTDVLPTNPGLSWSVDSAGAGFGSGADCSIAAGVLTCGPETVPAGTNEQSSTFWVHITSHTDKTTGGACDQSGGLVDNTGHVSTTNDGSDDSSAQTCVAAPAIHILKTADGSQVNAGDPIGFTMKVWNSGKGDAYNTTLTDTLPTNPGLNWQVAGQGAGWNAPCSIAVGVLTCGPDTVPAGTTKDHTTFTVHITSTTNKTTGGDCVETGGLVDNTGHVSTTNDGSDQSEATVCVAAPAIHILKTADASQVNAGDPIGFTMKVWNSGSGDAYNTTLTDTLPTNPGLNWQIAGQGTGWSSPCSISQSVLTCGPDTVPAGTTKDNTTFTVHITSTTNKTTGGDCVETGGLVDNTGDVTTSNDGSDQSSAQICVSPADVSITKTADHSAPVHAGDAIGFTLEVKNIGTGAATGVILNDPLPAGSGSGVTWAIDTSVGTPSRFVLSGAKGSQKLSLASSQLPAGADYKVHITAQTSETECGTYDNTATLTTANANNPSPVSAEESCAYRVDLSVTKSGSPTVQELGQGNITWTMVVKNNGPDTDTGVKISDPMPAGNTFVSASASPHGTCTGGAILTCDLGTMAAGEQVTITLVTTPSATGTQTNTVVVSGDRPETNLANNTATATVEVTGPAQLPCIAISRITPGHLIVGRKTTVTIYLTQGHKAAKGTRVRIKGAGIDIRTKPSNSKGVIKHVLKMKKKGILTFTPLAKGVARCGDRRIGVEGVFTPPVTG